MISFNEIQSIDDETFKKMLASIKKTPSHIEEMCSWYHRESNPNVKTVCQKIWAEYNATRRSNTNSPD